MSAPNTVVAEATEAPKPLPSPAAAKRISRKAKKGEKLQATADRMIARQKEEAGEAAPETKAEAPAETKVEDAALASERSKTLQKYGIVERDQHAELILQPFRVGGMRKLSAADRDATQLFRVGDRIFRVAQDNEKAHAVHPLKDNGNGPVYVRLVEMGKPVEITAPSEAKKGNGNGKAAIVIPDDKTLPLEKLGGVMAACRFVVKHFGGEHTNKELRAMVEKVYPDYKPGTIAIVRREQKGTEPVKPKAEKPKAEPVKEKVSDTKLAEDLKASLAKPQPFPKAAQTKKGTSKKAASKSKAGK